VFQQHLRIKQVVATMTAADILERLRACQAVLSDCDAVSHVLLSKGQSDVVLAMMPQTTISSDDFGAVAEAICKCNWSDPSDKTVLLKSLGTMAGKSADRPRAKLQDYETLAMFIPEQMWAALMDNEVDYHSKAALVCDHAVALQLRHPTEPTIACMVSLLVLATQGAVQARTMSAAYHHDLFVNLKDMLRKRAKCPAVAIIDKLGSDPASFMVEHPVIWAAVFARGGPARPKVAMTEITLFSNSINMRNRKGGREKTINPFAGNGGCGGGAGDGQFTMQSMMQQFLMQSMGAMLNRPAAASTHLPGGANLQIFGRGLPDAAPPALQLDPGLEQPQLAKAFVQPPLAQPPQTAPPPLQPRLPPIALAMATPPKRSVDEAAAAIMDAMGKRAEVRVEKKIAMKRPAAAVTCSGDEPMGLKPVTGKPEKGPLVSVEHSRSQVLYRSGLCGKGQTKIFKYSNDKERKRAFAQAEALVSAEKRRRGL
jgi:hypothetical protein